MKLNNFKIFSLVEFAICLLIIVWLFIKINKLEKKLLIEQAKREFANSYLLQGERLYDSTLLRKDTIYFYKQKSIVGSIIITEE